MNLGIYNLKIPFVSEKMAQPEQVQATQQDFLLDMNARVRSNEGRYNLLRDRVLVINQNMIEEWKKSTTEVRLLNDELKALKLDMFRMKDIMKHLINELEQYARKEDVKVLEKYINLWNPMKFVTESELKKILAQTEHNDN